MMPLDQFRVSSPKFEESPFDVIEFVLCFVSKRGIEIRRRR